MDVGVRPQDPPHRHLLVVAERSGGAGLLRALRQETSSTPVVHVLVPVVPASLVNFAVPFETGGWFPEGARPNGVQDLSCRHRAALCLSEMQALLWEMGIDSTGELVDLDLDRVVLATFDRLESDLVVVLCCGPLAARWSSRRLARRLRGRVPIRLIKER